MVCAFDPMILLLECDGSFLVVVPGEGQMPKFLGMVVDGRPYTTEELENVADFILQNAESDWKKFGLR
eukprot:2690521-Rhodomonas_salina.2